MKWLGQNKIESWIIGFLVAVVILLLLAAVGYLSGRWDQALGGPRTVDLYGDLPLDAKLLPIDRKALDEAYHAHLIKLFNVWLTDGARDATRFKTGLGIARNAYHIAAQAIAKREHDLAETERKQQDAK
jgi:hypothetical protein